MACTAEGVNCFRDSRKYTADRCLRGDLAGLADVPMSLHQSTSLLAGDLVSVLIEAQQHKQRDLFFMVQFDG